MRFGSSNTAVCASGEWAGATSTGMIPHVLIPYLLLHVLVIF